MDPNIEVSLKTGFTVFGLTANLIEVVGASGGGGGGVERGRGVGGGGGG